MPHPLLRRAMPELQVSDLSCPTVAAAQGMRIYEAVPSLRSLPLILYSFIHHRPIQTQPFSLFSFLSLSHILFFASALV